MYIAQPMQHFLDKLSSKSPEPGGGSAAAVTLAGLPAALLPATLAGQAEVQAEDLRGLVDFASGGAIRTSGSFVSSKVDLANTSTGFYPINGMGDFNNDIVNWNGSMVIAPRTAGGAAT